MAGEALEITERSGYVLQGADVHLFLAEIELEAGEKEKALAHAQAARRLAECDGPPDHTYKVAYDEAGALLAKLGEGAGRNRTTNFSCRGAAPWCMKTTICRNDRMIRWPL